MYSNINRFDCDSHSVCIFSRISFQAKASFLGILNGSMKLLKISHKREIPQVEASAPPHAGVDCVTHDILTDFALLCSANIHAWSIFMLLLSDKKSQKECDIVHTVKYIPIRFKPSINWAELYGLWVLNTWNIVAFKNSCRWHHKRIFHSFIKALKIK